MRKLVLVVGAALMLSLGTVPAVHAADYPPTTPVTASNSMVGSHSTEAATVADGTIGAANAPSTNSSLPFTGGDSGGLIWLGLAFVGAGAFATSTYRRRARTT